MTESPEPRSRALALPPCSLCCSFRRAGLSPSAATRARGTPPRRRRAPACARPPGHRALDPGPRIPIPLALGTRHSLPACPLFSEFRHESSKPSLLTPRRALGGGAAHTVSQSMFFISLSFPIFYLFFPIWPYGGGGRSCSSGGGGRPSPSRSWQSWSSICTVE
jgi:hypothetical protein